MSHTRNNLENFGDVAFNLLERGFFLFSGSVFICYITESVCSTWHPKQFAGMFHAWLGCFTLLKIGATEVCALSVLLVFNVIETLNEISELGFQNSYPIEACRFSNGTTIHCVMNGPLKEILCNWRDWLNAHCNLHVPPSHLGPLFLTWFNLNPSMDV